MENHHCNRLNHHRSSISVPLYINHQRLILIPKGIPATSWFRWGSLPTNDRWNQQCRCGTCRLVVKQGLCVFLRAYAFLLKSRNGFVILDIRGKKISFRVWSPPFLATKMRTKQLPRDPGTIPRSKERSTVHFLHSVWHFNLGPNSTGWHCRAKSRYRLLPCSFPAGFNPPFWSTGTMIPGRVGKHKTSRGWGAR